MRVVALTRRWAVFRKGGETMKKRLDKKTLEREALLWKGAKNALTRDDVKVCRK
jgi:hypothetical protein